MRVLSVLAATLLAGSELVSARSPQHVNKGYLLERHHRGAPKHNTRGFEHPKKRNDTGTIIPQNANTTKFAVNGRNIPEVSFDVGESYAGLLPISSKPNASELFFWFYPSSNPQASDEILIWLNGGPGCSSLEGLIQENGPWLWQSGTYAPVRNQYSWTNLTNVVWVEQPAGTGFSRVGTVGKPQNELDVAEQFLGFWKNFVSTFGLENRKVYITGES